MPNQYVWAPENHAYLDGKRHFPRITNIRGWQQGLNDPRNLIIMSIVLLVIIVLVEQQIPQAMHDATIATDGVEVVAVVDETWVSEDSTTNYWARVTYDTWYDGVVTSTLEIDRARWSALRDTHDPTLNVVYLRHEPETVFLPVELSPLAELGGGLRIISFFFFYVPLGLSLFLLGVMGWVIVRGQVVTGEVLAVMDVVGHDADGDPFTELRMDYQFTPPDGTGTITQAVKPRQHPAYLKRQGGAARGRPAGCGAVCEPEYVYVVVDLLACGMVLCRRVCQAIDRI